MIRLSNLLLLTAILSLSASRASAQPLLIANLQPEAFGFQSGYGQSGYGQSGYGQPGYGQGQVITCSSDDGKRHFCDIDTRRGVRLSRQISGSACIETQTWGYDNRGVWVDRGCRAEFAVGGNSGGGNWGNRPGQGQGNTVTCSSDNGRRNYCQTNGDLSRITLTRQISGSPCNRNSTWGVDSRGLWVDRGCRAEFAYGGGGGNWQGPGGNWPGQGGGQGQGQVRSITCSSNDGRRNFCAVNGGDLGSVTLTRQISGSPCDRGSTWGVDGTSGIWVDKGCRAEFQVNSYR